MMRTHSASKQGSIGHEPLKARSRREIFRHICAVVFDVAPRWGDAIDAGAAIVVTSSPLTRADVQSAFDEISEQYHVAGIDLRFDQQNGGPLQAIFEPIDRSDPHRALPPALARRSLTREGSDQRLLRGGRRPVREPAGGPDPSAAPDTIPPATSWPGCQPSGRC
jgi:hypothetical protein